MNSQPNPRRQAIRFLCGGFSAHYSPLILATFALLAGVTGIKSDMRTHAATGIALPTDRLGNHYLMLVNTAMASKMDSQKMAQFDRSPYDGLAVSFADAYDTSSIVSVAAMEAQMSGWKKSTTKDIWPWVYLNRMIGVNDAEGNAPSKVPYFQRFRGVDLDNSAGAQKDFLENWRNALHMARDTGVPGIRL